MRFDNDTFSIYIFYTLHIPIRFSLFSSFFLAPCDLPEHPVEEVLLRAAVLGPAVHLVQTTSVAAGLNNKKNNDIPYFPEKFHFFILKKLLLDVPGESDRDGLYRALAVDGAAAVLVGHLKDLLKIFRNHPSIPDH